ncbi:hypothetical protein CDD82_93 [Ophiocordyceps australis]|uniref:Uncharacterized protein n=1 Tax=Ophiocordyceps australis TaxID=1399860 RepID=A0A2C5YMX9_9HYPO|nr:hypothetical protein CDD82_93 [Ophiocordyceps australis]
MVRQYVLQHVEKAEHQQELHRDGTATPDATPRPLPPASATPLSPPPPPPSPPPPPRHGHARHSGHSGGIHAILSRSPSVWDSIVYRTWTANADSTAAVVARASRTALHRQPSCTLSSLPPISPSPTRAPSQAWHPDSTCGLYARRVKPAVATAANGSPLPTMLANLLLKLYMPPEVAQMQHPRH